MFLLLKSFWLIVQHLVDLNVADGPSIAAALYGRISSVILANSGKICSSIVLFLWHVNVAWTFFVNDSLKQPKLLY